MKAEGLNPSAEGTPQAAIRKVLVCFAVKEEARAFQELVEERGNLNIIIVGIGKRNAEQAIRTALSEGRPDLVLTCGFAGGLKPELAMGKVVFAADPKTGLEPALQVAGAILARFHCSDTVAATRARCCKRIKAPIFPGDFASASASLR